MIVYYINMRYKDEHKKEAIYEATILLLNKEGFSSTSMSKIANMPVFQLQQFIFILRIKMIC